MAGFDFHDIRRSMDVYTIDGVYVGTVLDIIPGAVVRNDEQAHERAHQSSEISGEMLGPMPTRPLGNSGPERQSAREWYAAKPDRASPIGAGAIRVGRWWGLRGRRTIPMDAVQTVSLERVVLKLKKEELAPDW